MLTNREAIDKMSSKELAIKIKALKDIPGFEYIDWEAWLKSENTDFPYIGEMVRFKPFEEVFAPCDWMEGTMVDTQVLSGVEHKIIVADDTLYKIPWTRVELRTGIQ